MKKTVSFLLTVILLFSLFFVLSPSVSAADSLYARKIVSVVYDDSGSMSGNKEAYANYALQSFCGMMNSEDLLFITFMRDSKTSNYAPFHVDLSTSGIQPSLDSIRKHTSGGNTPYRSVEIAMDKLRTAADTNQNTQYWLVIITDGQFDELNGSIDRELTGFVKEDMPNGTKPRVTFLGIGKDAVSPGENRNIGIFTYHAENAADIIDTMSEMADTISGRTRLKKSDLEQADGSTIRVKSSIPILNIVAFVQKTDANVLETKCSDGLSLPTVRTAYMRYPGIAELLSRSFLIGDSNRLIPAGTYDIAFDKEIDVGDLVILVEPALELRVSITVDGNPISGSRELAALHKGDTVSISCGIYEMGTDKEVQSTQLPSNTVYSLQLLENGVVKKEDTTDRMTIDNFTLTDLETTIKASVTIDGFKLLPFSTTFTPLSAPRVTPTPAPTPEPTATPKPDYTITASPKSSVRSVNWSDIGSNEEVGVVFTFFVDGKQIRDPSSVKELNPVINVSPAGNDGSMEYRNDGTVVFTPTSAAMVSGASGSMEVQVTCTIYDGTSGTESYSVLISDYQVVPVLPHSSAVKTELYGNMAGAQFYVTKDGARLPKSELDGKCRALFEKEYPDLSVRVRVESDGTITCIPYSNEEHHLTFFNWWINWYRYWFLLPGGELDVEVSTPFGTGNNQVDIQHAPLSYRLCNVYLPLLIEVAFLTVLTIWLILYFKKPRFAKNAKLYVGEIRFDHEDRTHEIRNFRVKNLSSFNRFKYLWRFKKDAEVVTAHGIRIRAEHNGRIVCEEMMPWYRDRVTPIDFMIPARTPAELLSYFSHARSLFINEFNTVDTINGDQNHSIGPANHTDPHYIVVPDAHNGVEQEDDRIVLNRGKIIIYTTI